MAAGLWRISKPLAKGGKVAWTVCCANTFKRMGCLKANDDLKTLSTLTDIERQVPVRAQLAA